MLMTHKTKNFITSHNATRVTIASSEATSRRVRPALDERSSGSQLKFDDDDDDGNRVVAVRPYES